MEFSKQINNELKNKIEKINKYAKPFESEVQRIKEAWMEVSEKFTVRPKARTFIKNLFNFISYSIKDSSGFNLFKQILSQLNEYGSEGFDKIYSYVLATAIINYKYNNDTSLQESSVIDSLNLIIPSIVRNKLTFSELTDLVLGLNLIFLRMYPEKKAEISRIMRKAIRKKIPEDDVAEELINKLSSEREKIIKSNNYGMDNFNEAFINVFSKINPKLRDFITEGENIAKINSSKEEIVQTNESVELFRFDDVLDEENQGEAKKAKDAVAYAKKTGKLKKPNKCSRCGKLTSALEFAHKSYAKKNWLKGKWLCKSCHGRENKREANKRGAMGKYNPSGKYPKKY